ncbi:MAG: TPM domain-containing protein [Bacteroidota bacterium]
MNLVKPLLSSHDLAAIGDAVAAAEQQTGGEIRVEIRQRRTRAERPLSIEQIARREFEALGMTNTRDRTGVLLFLLLEDREFCIFADEGIHARVEPDTWTRIATPMAERFGRRQFRDGLLDAVREVVDVLRRHVPRRADDRNELPNDVVIR